MQKIFLMVVLAGVLAMCGGCVSLTHQEPLPEETIEELEAAMNAMDVNGMLNCMDEGTVKSVTAGMNLALGITGAVTGIDLGISAEDLIAAVPLFQGIMGAYGYETGSLQVDFEVLETYIKGSRATVYFLEANSGEEMVLNMKKEKNMWLITLDTRYLAPEDADKVIIAGEEEETEAEQEDMEISLWDMMGRENLENYLREVLSEE